MLGVPSSFPRPFVVTWDFRELINGLLLICINNMLLLSTPFFDFWIGWKLHFKLIIAFILRINLKDKRKTFLSSNSLIIFRWKWHLEYHLFLFSFESYTWMLYGSGPWNLCPSFDVLVSKYLLKNAGPIHVEHHNTFFVLVFKICLDKILNKYLWKKKIKRSNELFFCKLF